VPHDTPARLLCVSASLRDNHSGTAGQASSGTQVIYRARPIDPARPRSPWIVLPEDLKTDLDQLTGPSDYTANLGANSGGANGVYWLEVVGVDSTGASRSRFIGRTPATPGLERQRPVAWPRSRPGAPGW